MNLTEFRQKNPGYGDLSDAELADALHRKFYSDIPKEDFYKSLGLGPQTFGEKLESGIKSAHRFITGADKPGDTTYTDKAMQGMTFGFGDELRAGVRSLVPGTSYKQERDAIRKSEKEFDARNPVGSVVAEIAGGMALGGPLSAVGKATGLSNIGAKIPGVLRATGAGVASGAAYGAGTSEEEDFAGIAKDTGKGAAIGGVVAPLAYGASRGVAALGRGIKSLKSGVNPRGGALDALAADLADDQISPQRLQARLNALGPQATIADAGKENVLASARAVASTRGGRTKAGMLVNRSEGEGKRIVGQIEKSVGPTDYFGAEETFMKTLRDNADVLYREAYKAPPIKNDKINEILSRKPVRQAISAAREIAEAKGETLKIPKDFSGGVPVEAIDDIKRGLDAMMDSPKARNQFGKLNKYGAAVNRLKTDLLKAVDDAVPAYRAARAQYSGDAEVANALKEGREFLRLAPEQIKKRLSELSSEAARKAFRSGGARALAETVEKSKDTANASARIFGDQFSREKIRALMPDKQSYDELARTLRSENRFNQVKNAILGGSQTQPRQRGEKELIDRLGSAAAVAGSNLPVGHQLVVASNMRKIAQAKLASVFDKRSSALADMLLTRDPVKNSKIIADLVAMYGQTGKSTTTAFSRALARVAAQQGVEFSN